MKSPINDDLEVALRYVHQLQRTVGSKKSKRIYKLSKKFRVGNLSIPDFISSVNQLLNDHHELFQGFTSFFPENYPITSVKSQELPKEYINGVDYDVGSPKRHQLGSVESFDDEGCRRGEQNLVINNWEVAQLYLKQIKETLGGGSDKCKSFCTLLREYGDEKLSVPDWISSIKELLRGHHDLLQGFTVFLPMNYRSTFVNGNEFDLGYRKKLKSSDHVPDEDTATVNFNESDVGSSERQKICDQVAMEDTATINAADDEFPVVPRKDCVIRLKILPLSDVGSQKRQIICDEVAMEDNATINADDELPVISRKRQKFCDQVAMEDTTTINADELPVGSQRTKKKSRDRSKRHKFSDDEVLKIQQAADFVNRVRERFNNGDVVYKTFLDSLCEYNKEGKPCSIHEFEKKMELLLKDHPDLLRELSRYTKDLYVADESLHRKSVNKYKAMLFKCEDHHFEVDLAFHRFESVSEKIKLLVEDAKEGVQIPNLNEYFTPINLRCFEVLYGADDEGIIDQLRKNTINAGVRVLFRLNQKLDQLKDHRRDAEKVWANVYKLCHEMLQKSK